MLLEETDYVVFIMCYTEVGGHCGLRTQQLKE